MYKTLLHYVKEGISVNIRFLPRWKAGLSVRWLGITLIVVSLLALLQPSLNGASASPDAYVIPGGTTVFINEFHYDNASTDVNEFIEIAGPAGTNLAGWSVVLYNGNGGAVYNTIALSGTLANDSNGYGFSVLSFPSNGIQNGAPDGIALANGTTLIQFLSYEGSFTAVGGVADGYTSTNIGVTESSSTLSTESLYLTGTGSQYSDFTWTGPAASTSGSVNTGQTFSAPANAAIVTSCPSTISTLEGVATSDTATASDSDSIVDSVTVTVNPVEAGITSSFTAAVADGGTASVDLSVAATVAAGTYTVTLDFENDDAQTASCVIDVEVVGTDLIHDIQGSGSSVTNSGATVRVQAIVVGDYQESDELDGFYIQEETTDEDGNDATSEGIFVYCGNSCVANFGQVAVGDLVTVVGTQGEYANQSQINVTGSGGSVAIDTAGAGIDLVTTFNVLLPIPEGTSLADFWEPLEGMLIQFPQTLTVTEHYNLGYRGQVVLSVGGRQYQYTHLYPPDATTTLITAYEDEVERSRILLDDYHTATNPDPVIHPEPTGLTPTNTLRGGDQTTGLLSIVTQYYSDYRMERAVPITWDHANPRPAVPGMGDATLVVASANVLNFFTSLAEDPCPYGTNNCRGAWDAFEYDRQLDRLVSNLLGIDADVYGLMEIENHATDDTLQALVDGLNAVAGAGTYAFIPTGPIGTDAIKVALIYKPATVQPYGSYMVLDSVYPFDTNTRPPLAQSFEEVSSGEIFTVVVNHFKSKGCSSPTPENVDTGDGQGCHNQDRIDAANALMSWLSGDPTGSGDADLLILGDLNAYVQEDPINTLKSYGLTNLVEEYHGPLAYSYVYGGEWGYLDYAFANSALLSQITAVDDWHVNADEPRAYDYNDWNQASLWDGSMPYRASDHDPILIGLALGTDQTAGPGETPGEADIDAFDPALSKVGALPQGAIGLTGEQLTWTITVTNNGTATGYDLYITDTLRSELRIDNASTARGTATVSGQTVTFYIPYLNPGESVQMQLLTTVLTSPLDGMIDNTAALSGTGANGSVVTRSASDTVTLAALLPSTGYSRDEAAGAKSGGSSNGVWYALVAAVLLGGLYVGVTRMRRQRQ